MLETIPGLDWTPELITFQLIYIGFVAFFTLLYNLGRNETSFKTSSNNDCSEWTLNELQNKTQTEKLKKDRKM